MDFAGFLILRNIWKTYLVMCSIIFDVGVCMYSCT